MEKLKSLKIPEGIHSRAKSTASLRGERLMDLIVRAVERELARVQRK